MKVRDLEPGMRFKSLGLDDEEWVFITQTGHPQYRDLELVVWKSSRGTFSFDALDHRQDVGEPVDEGPAPRKRWVDNLRGALLG